MSMQTSWGKVRYALHSHCAHRAIASAKGGCPCNGGVHIHFATVPLTAGQIAKKGSGRHCSCGCKAAIGTRFPERCSTMINSSAISVPSKATGQSIYQHEAHLMCASVWQYAVHMGQLLVVTVESCAQQKPLQERCKFINLGGLGCIQHAAMPVSLELAGVDTTAPGKSTIHDTC